MADLEILEIKWNIQNDLDGHKGYMKVIANSCVRHCTLTQMKGIIDLAARSDRSFDTDNMQKIYRACQEYENELKQIAKELLANHEKEIEKIDMTASAFECEKLKDKQRAKFGRKIKPYNAKFNRMEKIKKYMFMRWDFKD